MSSFSRQGHGVSPSSQSLVCLAIWVYHIYAFAISFLTPSVIAGTLAILFILYPLIYFTDIAYSLDRYHLTVMLEL
jgi:hypothetical protein